MTHRLSFNPFLHASQIFDLLVEALALDPAKLPSCPVQPVESVEERAHPR